MKFKDLSIKRKITYLYLPLAIIPMIIFAVISMKFYESAIINRTLASMQDNNVLISDRIDGILAEAEGSATLLTIGINRLINSDPLYGMLTTDIKLYNLISNELIYAKRIYEHIDAIGFIDINERLYYTDYALQNEKSDILTSEMYERLKNTTGNSVWFNLESRAFLSNSPDKKILTLGKKIWNINTGETIGYLFINIDESAFTQVFKDQLASFYIYKDQQLISESEPLQINSQELNLFMLENSLRSDILFRGKDRVLVSKMSIERLGWTLLSEADLNLFTQDLANLLLLVGILLSTIIILEITMTLVLNRWITTPIMKLKRGVEEISNGNFEYRFKMKTNDEIGLFAQSFNHMSEQIEKLLSDVEREEKKKREYEFALIQQQIKPHFLYNSLDIILKLSQLGQERKAQKVIRRLANYYRNSLSGGADVISVNDELKITLDYLELQKLRYSGVFNYKIEVFKSLNDVMIPKLSLQPIVENAIEHGFKNLSSHSLINIFEEVNDFEKSYQIVIKDNGVGIKKIKVQQLNEMLNSKLSPNDSENIQSFGMKNVNHRLKLYFGNDYGIHVISEEDSGTEIRIKLPYEIGGVQND